MHEVLTTLLDDTARQLRLMDVAIRENDPKRTMRLAHSCKGACANVGANAVAAALRVLEQQAASEAFDQCAATMGSLNRELERLRVEIERMNAGF
jgi:HPt (histidine-containing phosphotransfer) domain-containing protein